MERINEATIYPAAKDPRMYTMTKPFIAIYVAKPEQGKSVAIKYLIHRMCSADTVSHGWVYTGTAFNKDYSYLPANCVTSEFSIEHLKKILAYQSKNPTKMPAFIVFDDMVAQINWRDKTIRSLFMNFRHYNIRLIVASQYFRAMDAQVREQTTFYIVFGKQADLGLEAIAKGAFAGKRKIEVANILSANCKKFVHLVCDLNADDDSEAYLRFRVPLIKDFKIEAFWPLKNKPADVKCGTVIATSRSGESIEAEPAKPAKYDTVDDEDSDSDSDSDTQLAQAGSDDDEPVSSFVDIRPMVTRHRKI